MSKIVFQNIALKSESKVIAENISFFVEGFRNLELESTNDSTCALKSLFTLRNTSFTGELTISGDVLIDGKRLPFEQFRLLLNRSVLFDQRETLRSVLSFVNPKRAKELLQHAASLADRQMGTLSVGETRIVDLLVSLAANPPLIFIENIELPGNLRCKYLHLLKKHVKETGTPSLVVSDYKPFFDGSVILQESRVFSVTGKAAVSRNTQSILARFDFERPSSEVDYSDEVPTDVTGEYDYRSHFTAYKCENLVELIRQGSNFSSRFRTYDFYRISFRRAITLALRKYSLMLSQYSDTRNIFRNLKPFIIFLLCIRFFQKFGWCDLFDNIFEVLLFTFTVLVGTSKLKYALTAFIVGKLYSRCLLSLSGTYSCPLVFWNLFSKVYHTVLKEGYTFSELRVITAFLYLCIFSATTSVLEEDRAFIDWYSCILFTPATYFFAMFIYTTTTQVFTFYALMKLFNLPSAGLILHNIIVSNFFFASIRSKRLREFLIAWFLTLYLLPSLDRNIKLLTWIYNYLSYLFPPLITSWQCGSVLFSCKTVFMLLFIFDALTFVLCTIRLSHFRT